MRKHWSTHLVVRHTPQAPRVATTLMKRSRAGLLVMGCVVVACTTDGGPAGAACPLAWQRRLIADSTATICVLPGFLARNSRRYARPRGDTLPETWFSVSAGATANWHDSWPIRLASGADCLADCATAEAVRPIVETIAGRGTVGERGLVSGGFSGLRRQPMLIMNVELRPQLRAVVYGVAHDSTTLDTLLMVARTVRPSTR
jgi:hypothetical protein